MQINWFTVVAQLINFLVLVWLMKKYLYKPILQAIDDREKKITAELDEAKAREDKAQAEKDDFISKNKAFDADRKNLMDKAVAEVDDERQKLLEAAKKDADALRAKLAKSLADAQLNLNGMIAQQARQQVISIAKKALAGLASTNLEEQSVHVFISRIKALGDTERDKFITAFRSASTPVTVSTAFGLQEDEQAAVKDAISGILAPETGFEFKTRPEIVSGIELSTNGYKLSWSFPAYISSLGASITEAMKEEKPVTV